MKKYYRLKIIYTLQEPATYIPSNNEIATIVGREGKYITCYPIDLPSLKKGVVKDDSARLVNKQFRFFFRESEVLLAYAAKKNMEKHLPVPDEVEIAYSDSWCYMDEVLIDGY